MSTDRNVTEDLMETLEDGKDGFAHAADKLAESGQTELSEKMRGYSTQRADFYAELERLAAVYGDNIDEDGSARAAIHRMWMSVKDTISGSSPEGVLDAAEQGESHALDQYRDALDKDISDNLRTIVERQMAEITTARDGIKALRAAFD